MQSKKYDGQVTTTLPNAYFQTYIFDAIKKKLKKKLWEMYFRNANGDDLIHIQNTW